ncbi:MAG: precorrin-8X methylmutase [Pseudomonadota bacterium]
MVEFEYQKNPAEIYQQSFSIVQAEADFSRLPTEFWSVATRLIHACGMIDIVQDLAFSGAAVTAGQTALRKGTTVYCDVEMVRSGIISASLPEGIDVACMLNDPRIPPHARKIGNTRSAAAVDYWDELEGSIVVIGNAPTALFHLMERVNAGYGKPALVVGIPVGFVGAVESKQMLATNTLGLEYITVLGRRGGSAMASSVLNALAKDL